MLSASTGCSDSRMTITQSSREGPVTYELTCHRVTWSNTEKGGCCLALTHQWNTHAGQFILHGVRSSYVRMVVHLPRPLEGPGSGYEMELRPGMVQAYDDAPDRGLCYTGGPGRISLQCGEENKVTGSLEVTCRGFLPGRQEMGLFGDEYVFRVKFEAEPDAAATLRTADEVGWYFATPQKRNVPVKEPPMDRRY